MSVGNEENLAKVRELMTQANQVNQGGDLQNSVYIDYTSNEGRKYQGTIIFKRPTMKDYMRMGALKSEILRMAGVQDLKMVDNAVLYTATELSTLTVVIKKCPEWLLDLEAIEEVDLLDHVYERFNGWLDSFRPQPDTQFAGNSEASAGAGTMATSEVLRESAADRPTDSSNDAGADKA